MRKELRHHETAVYQIRFQGAPDESWIQSLNPDLAVQVDEDDQQSAITTLTGSVRDQAALLGLLNHLYNMGLSLLSVDFIK